MTSPSLDGMSDALDSSGATLNTVVENTKKLNLDDGLDTTGEGAIGLSDMSDGAMSQTSDAQVTTVNQNFHVTKVYYYIDEEPTPYMTEVSMAPDLITLGDVKRALMRSNFKYYLKTYDADAKVDVKAEIRDDAQKLKRSPNGRFELYLLTVEGSTTSDGSSGLPRGSRHHMVPGPAPQPRYNHNQMYRHAVNQYDSSMLTTDSESMVSAPVNPYIKGSLNRRHLATQQNYMRGHRGHRYEDSTIGSESDARVFSDEDDRGSTTTDITSVSRQHENMYRKRHRRRHFKRPSRASSFSSITESSMSLDVITVTLNMDTVNFLGISIVGQSSARGDNGIYVANIMKGGAVALDGRIEAGDMILQVNDISFENFTNDQAVDVLRDAVARKGPIKLTVAKCFENGPKSCFTIPRNARDEPVRPIDTQAWIQHTNAMRGMPSILEGSEGAPTPIPGDWPHGRPPSSSTVTSNGSGGQNTVVGGKLTIHSDKKKIVQALALPNSGLEIKDRTWLKIPIAMGILGSDLVDWLLDHIEGLRDRKDAKKFAGELVRANLICHMVNQTDFSEQGYYYLGPECTDFLRYRTHPEEIVMVPTAGGGRWQWAPTGGGAGIPKSSAAPASMVSGYVSMPVSPFPHMMGRGVPDVRSQASGHSGEGSGSGSDHKRRAVVLPAPPSSHLPSRLEEVPSELAASRQSFRQAMNHPYEFFVDNL